MSKLLVVIDVQNDFVTGILGTKEAQAIVPKVVEKINSFDGEIVFTRDTHFSNYLETQEGKNLPVEHCVHGTDGWNICNEIEEINLDRYTIYDKFTFGSVRLAEAIRNGSYGDLDEIELVGLCTDICVISNALLIKAFKPEIKITVDASCCAGVTPESHRNALEAMKMCQINVINE